MAAASRHSTVFPGGPAWVLKAAAALLISLAAWEILLRLFVTVPINSHHVEGLGWLPLPHRNGLWTVEGHGICRYNTYGFRDAEVQPRKAGETRILVLGDSHVEARQVEQDQTFTDRLQVLLNEGARARTSTRVFNAGRNGASPAAHIALAQPYKEIFQPDWVVVVVEDGRWPTVFVKGQETYYTPVAGGFATKVHWLKDRLPRSFRLRRRLGLNELALSDWSYRRLSSMRSGGDEDAAGASDGGKGPARTTAAANPYTQVDGPLGLDKVIGWTMHALRQTYPNLVVVHLPGHTAELGNLQSEQPDEALVARYCKQEGIPLIRMRDRINADFARTGIPPFGFSNTLPWYGHTNAHGHELIAEALRDFFAPKIAAAS